MGQIGNGPYWAQTLPSWAMVSLWLKSPRVPLPTPGVRREQENARTLKDIAGQECKGLKLKTKSSI